jgi:prevent-host-death family protein
LAPTKLENNLPRLIRAIERGETVIITRHGKPIAQLAPIKDRREEVAEAIQESSDCGVSYRKCPLTRSSRRSTRVINTELGTGAHVIGTMTRCGPLR